MAAFVWECVIATVYWTLLFSQDLKQNLRDHPGKQIVNVFAHGVPLVTLTLDFLLNRVYFEFNQVYANLAVISFYGVINFVVTLASGEPVYPPMSWDSWWSVLLALSMLLIAFLYWVVIFYISKCKFKRMRMVGVASVRGHLSLGVGHYSEPS